MLTDSEILRRQQRGQSFRFVPSADWRATLGLRANVMIAGPKSALDALLEAAMPELRDCRPPGIRNINIPRDSEGRPVGPSLGPQIVPRIPEPTPAAKDAIAQAGIEYARSLREAKLAEIRVAKAREELERA